VGTNIWARVFRRCFINRQLPVLINVLSSFPNVPQRNTAHGALEQLICVIFPILIGIICVIAGAFVNFNSNCGVR